MIGSPNMTVPDDSIQQASTRTYDGMASWAGGGPAETTCAQCTRWGGHRKTKPAPTAKSKCAKYREIMGPHRPWPLVPGEAPSCRHFEPIERPWSGHGPPPVRKAAEQARML